ncbi:hypothetical protein COCCADRAFT_91254 [Bipolaris zeicola 26-R-13]|uniref:Uncharacterized protein n=1 Tax=Cochliobolus carbonum (strain 26-R-13) TaxID=930089 RepID=W6YUR0_COCC2|nr:uncharacterized protein COCCADRAFT_91254 [Bipolaris zeicola 26-R-13]EUC35216.1 hypothetical protein COCCADRAFT_91254 [Bipolaris zeicola 26-R-13]
MLNQSPIDRSILDLQLQTQTTSFFPPPLPEGERNLPPTQSPKATRYHISHPREEEEKLLTSIFCPQWGRERSTAQPSSAQPSLTRYIIPHSQINHYIRGQ